MSSNYIYITFKRSIITETIIGEVKEFDDNTVHQNYGELEKPILDLENGNRRIDALDIWICYMIFLNGIKLEKYLDMAIGILTTWLLSKNI